jgi:hypothetical protein
VPLDGDDTPHSNKDRKSHPSHLGFTGRGRLPAWQRALEAAIGSRVDSAVAGSLIRTAAAVLRGVAGAFEDAEELPSAGLVNARSSRGSIRKVR